MIKSAGMKSCELEDIVAMDTYFDLILHKYHIELNTKEFKKRNKPWSDRLHNAADKSPGIFDEKVESSIKTDLSNLVVEHGMDAIAKYDQQYVINLINSIAVFADELPIPLDNHHGA